MQSSEVQELLAKIKEEKEKTERALKGKIKELELTRNKRCYAFMKIGIERETLEKVFEDLKKDYSDCDGKLDVIIDCFGGDAGAAYNLGFLFRKYGHENLTYIVPRMAKSAATILCCSGDQILMSDIAELGPIDVQFFKTSSQHGREESEPFSPLDIEEALEIIRNEFMYGSRDMAINSLRRMPSPMLLGCFLKANDIGKSYLKSLLSTRMLKGDIENANQIADKLAEGYAHHLFCINLHEAKELGLKVNEIEIGQFDMIWHIQKLYDRMEKIDYLIDILSKEEMLEINYKKVKKNFLELTSETSEICA